jgi:hypothetical protein
MITLAQARSHLRIDGTQDDAEIQLKLTMAQALVDRYVGKPPANPYAYVYDLVEPTAEEWSNFQRYEQDHFPEEGKDVAVLMALGELWVNREAGGDPLSQSVRNILNMYREPTYA